MNQKIKILLLPMILAAFFCACSELEVEKGVQINIEESALYEKSEIQSAIDVCVDYFNTKFEGCTLIDISYDEELCMKEKYTWEYQYKEDEAIILLLLLMWMKTVGTEVLIQILLIAIGCGF